jgi:hypothetical protein
MLETVPLPPAPKVQGYEKNNKHTRENYKQKTQQTTRKQTKL